MYMIGDWLSEPHTIYSTSHEFRSIPLKVDSSLAVTLDCWCCLIMAGFAEFLWGFSTNGQLLVYLGVFHYRYNFDHEPNIAWGFQNFTIFQSTIDHWHLMFVSIKFLCFTWTRGKPPRSSGSPGPNSTDIPPPQPSAFHGLCFLLTFDQQKRKTSGIWGNLMQTLIYFLIGIDDGSNKGFWEVKATMEFYNPY